MKVGNGLVIIDGAGHFSCIEQPDTVGPCRPSANVPEKGASCQSTTATIQH